MTATYDGHVPQNISDGYCYSAQSTYIVTGDNPHKLVLRVTKTRHAVVCEQC